MNIKVIGYFGHANVGDQQYQLTFRYLFQEYLCDSIQGLEFIDCDLISTKTFNDTDLIILGGGDVLNDYFLDKIISKFYLKPNKIIAISVGIPYPSMSIQNKMQSIIDYIFIRTNQDLSFFPKHRIFYLPDLSIFLKNLVVPEIPQIITENKLQNKLQNKLSVAITMNQHVAKNNPDYSFFMKSFCKVVTELISQGYHIVLIPFNTNSRNADENDLLIHNDLVNRITQSETENVTTENFTIITSSDPLQIFNLYRTFNFSFAITMRYHSCLFALHNNVPFLPIFTTRKIQNLMTDISKKSFYKLPTINDLPGYFDSSIVINLLKNLKVESNYDVTLHHLQTLRSVINDTCNFSKGAPNYTKIVISTKNQIARVLERYNCNNLSAVPETSSIRKLIVEIVSFQLTGTPNSPYNYGLESKMFLEDFNCDADFLWILEDASKNHIEKLYDNPHGIFNINYIDQIDYSGAHRAGWQYVYNNIKYLNNSNVDLLLDLYLDRTFHWNCDVNATLGIIPYRKPWTGFVHHTFESSFSDYNCYKLFENKLFIESLITCKGIFVLSKNLQKLFKECLEKVNFGHIKCIALVHPTEIDVPKFNPKLFVNNSDKKVLHIGGWLRNIYSFYQLKVPSTIKCTIENVENTETKNKCIPSILSIPRKMITREDSLRKVAVKGLNMNNYYPEPNFQDLLTNCLSKKYETTRTCTQNASQCISQNASQNASQCISQNASQCISQNASHNSRVTNNWYLNFIDNTLCDLKTVDTLDRVSNKDYDKLLTENIVFLNLIDASAVNTLIECIVRCTPILINKLPAVTELLGNDYPLYINENVTELFTENKILEAYRYLEKLSKEPLTIEYFIKTFREAVSTL